MGCPEDRSFSIGFRIGAETRAGATGYAPHEKRPDRRRAMTDAACTPLRPLAPSTEHEQSSDRFAELLECMADLLVETRRQRVEIAQRRGSDDPRVAAAIARLTELEHSLGDVGVEDASAHHLLQHIHLI
jgi:hypothetical protein